MKKYILPIISNLVTIGIVWGILGQLSYDDNLQTIATLIILVYVNLYSQAILSTRLNLSISLATLEYLGVVLKHQGDESSHDEIHFDTKKISNEIEFKKASYHTNLIGIIVIWVSCVLVILGNL